MIHDARGKLAHFKKLDMRNAALVPGDKEIKSILDGLAEVLYLLGYQPSNKPHYTELDTNATNSTQAVIDKIISPYDKDGKIRAKYMMHRSDWYSD
jgi:hypothetical protein